MSLEKLKTVDWANVGSRAFRTFVQAALAALVVPVAIDSSKAWYAAVLAAVAAGLSAVLNVAQDLVSRPKA